LKARELVVHDEDEASVLINGSGIDNGMVMGANVVPLAEVLMRYDIGSAAHDHDGSMSNPNVDPSGVAILVGEVKFNEAIAVNVDVQTLDIDGVAKAGVGALKEGGAMRLKTYVGTGVHKAGTGGSGRTGAVVRGGGAILKSGAVNRTKVAGGGRIGVVRMKICAKHETKLKLLV
jgi:hypothetical protein